MLSVKKRKAFYRAMITKDSNYEGIFYVGVKTTGIFCRPTCPARKPKFENCDFFKTAKDAVLASYKPCQRCRPLSHPNQVPIVIQKLVKAVEENPEKRWNDSDFRALSIDVSTARRQFKKRFGMTFVEYARARRMGMAMKQIRGGHSVIEAQLSAGYESGSGFRDAFAKIIGAAPSLANALILKTTWLDTALGPMLAIADDEKLYLLEFVDKRSLAREVERLRKKLHAAIVPGENKILKSIAKEIVDYFSGKSVIFKTPIQLMGSAFQKQVWEELLKIPPGETRSYVEIAKAVKKPTAYRAVANANGANQLAIIVPCHRVINVNGALGGYAGGVARKQWLLDLEKNA